MLDLFVIFDNKQLKTSGLEKELAMSPTSSTSDRMTVQEQVVSVMEEMQILGTLDKLIAASEVNL